MVDNEVSAAFLQHLEQKTATRRPKAVHQTIVRLWNRRSASIVGWPSRQLKVPSYVRKFALPWAAFPASFQAEANDYAATLACNDLFDPKAPTIAETAHDQMPLPIYAPPRPPSCSAGMRRSASPR